MIRIIIALLALWLIITILGFVIKGLFWLAILGIILFAATGAWSWIRQRL